MIKINCFSSQALVWLSELLTERFGVLCHVQSKDNALILQINADAKIFFPTLIPEFHTNKNKLSCFFWNICAEGFNSKGDNILPMPSMVAPKFPLIEWHGEKEAIINYDILGLIYWMLTRQEEIGSEQLDSRDRFMASSSHAYQYGYLERPIVDEWIQILTQIIHRLLPGIELKKHSFRICPTHDVDRPSKFAYWPLKNIVKNMIKDLVVRKDISTFWNAPRIVLGSKVEFKIEDTFNTFNWLMDVSDANSVKSAFYFIAGNTSELDAYYTLNDGAIRNLMQRIHARGHEIGIHPSYNTFRNPEILKAEYIHLREVCNQLGIVQDKWGGRMHYLRWQQDVTQRAWDDAGIDYDSTLSFADHAGFRCGTCFEYSAFDVKAQKILNLRIRPLIFMEASLFVYQGLGVGQKALEKILMLRRKCEEVNGQFVFLWHNDQFESQLSRELYLTILNKG